MRAEARGRVDAFNSQLSYDQAKQAFEVGRFEIAMRQIDGALARYPDAPEYHLLKGRICLETHRLEEAIDSFVTALEKDENCAEAYYFAGIVLQRWSDDEAAYEHYSRAYEIEPANVQYLLAAAESLIALGEFEVARELVEEKLAYFEYNAALRHLLGQIAMLQGDPVTAAECFAQARLLNPDDLTLLEELVWAQFAAGSFSQCYDSITYLKHLLDEPRADLLRLEARCLAIMERNTEARDLYLKIIRNNGADLEAWIELGTLAWELGDFRRVAQCSERIIAIAPDRYEGYLLKGVYERETGNDQEALRLFREAASRSPHAALPHLMLGRMLENTGDLEGAVTAYAHAARIETNNTDAQVLMRRLNDRQRLTVVEDGETWEHDE
ncbi:MAG: tetratricopeptide repeat protein [Phycisphaerales bacterium]|nr:MAG: tetratricopeptide repeat protein [Phycisphaerales bacterium]